MTARSISQAFVLPLRSRNSPPKAGFLFCFSFSLMTLELQITTCFSFPAPGHFTFCPGRWSFCTPTWARGNSLLREYVGAQNAEIGAHVLSKEWVTSSSGGRTKQPSTAASHKVTRCRERNFNFLAVVKKSLFGLFFRPPSWAPVCSNDCELTRDRRKHQATFGVGVRRKN